MAKKSNIPTKKCPNCDKKVTAEYIKISDTYMFYCSCGAFWEAKK